MEIFAHFVIFSFDVHIFVIIFIFVFGFYLKNLRLRYVKSARYPMVLSLCIGLWSRCSSKATHLPQPLAQATHRDQYLEDFHISPRHFRGFMMHTGTLNSTRVAVSPPSSNACLPHSAAPHCRTFTSSL